MTVDPSDDDSTRPRRSRVTAWWLAGAGGLIIVVLSIAYAVHHAGGRSGPPFHSSTSSALVIDDCSAGHREPSTITITCGDATTTVENLTWSSWADTSAVAQGDLTQVSCVPDCADGQDVAYPAMIRLSDPVRAGGGTVFFTLITVDFDRTGPDGTRILRFKDCDDSPSSPFMPRCPADLQGTPP